MHATSILLGLVGLASLVSASSPFDAKSISDDVKRSTEALANLEKLKGTLLEASRKVQTANEKLKASSKTAYDTAIQKIQAMEDDPSGKSGANAVKLHAYRIKVEEDYKKSQAISYDLQHVYYILAS